jgi:hypothetical protein
MSSLLAGKRNAPSCFGGSGSQAPLSCSVGAEAMLPQRIAL